MNDNIKNQKTMYILSIIIIIGLVYIVLLFSGVINFNGINGNNNNNPSEKNIEYVYQIDSDVENVDEIFKIIGLTDKGYPRLNEELKSQYQLSGDNYIDYDCYDIAKIFMDLKGGEYQVKDLNSEELNKLLFNYSIADFINLENIDSNGNKNHPCYEGTGSCFGISEEDYKKIAKVYNLSPNPSDLLTKYQNLYIIKTFATWDNPREIKDGLVIKNVEDGVEAKYNVSLKTVKGYDQNGDGFTKTITFKLKKDTEGKYNLDKIIVEEK